MIWHIISYLVQKLILTVDDLITGDLLLEVDIHTLFKKRLNEDLVSVYLEISPVWLIMAFKNHRKRILSTLAY